MGNEQYHNDSDFHNNQIFSSSLAEFNISSDNSHIPFRRRRSTISYFMEEADTNSNEESNVSSNDNINNNDIWAFDINMYPITINWVVLEKKKEYHSMFKARGALGIVILNCIPHSILLYKKHKNIVYQIIEYYIFCLKKITKNTFLIDFMDKLPTLNQIRIIITHDYYSSKEIILIKIIIDCYHSYLKRFDGPLYTTLVNELFSLAEQFYSQLSISDIQSLNKELNRKNIGRKIKKNMKSWFYKTKRGYIKGIEKTKKVYQIYSGGLTSDNFIILYTSIVMGDELLDDTIKTIESYFFGEEKEQCGEYLFIQFAKEKKDIFLKAKLSHSTQNQFEFYTELFQQFQVIYESKLEELIIKGNMTVESFYEALSKRCEEGDQEIILFVDIINEIINYNSFIEMMANLVNKV